MRYLIINADDFGVCPATNEAVETAFEAGVLSSTTLMTPCPAASDAVMRAKANTKMHMGLHITTTSEWVRKWGPVLPANRVPSLTDEDGHFYPSSEAFARNARQEEVAAEIEAQYQYITDNGLVPTHADSHMGSVYGIGGPSFMKETLEFCARHKLPFRFPRHLDGVKEIVHVASIPPELEAAHAQAVAYADALGVKLIDFLVTCPASYAELTSYEVLKSAYFGAISRLPEGLSEIYMHPSLESSPNAKDNPRWQVRIWEHRLLLDSDLKKHIEQEGIILTGYSHLQ
jgi:predicted glycoside hydrolase/deacetylase ChbG (UPF0249 family)